MHPAQFIVQGEHVILDLLRDGSGFRIVVAINEHLYWRGNGLIVQLTEAHMSLWEVIGVFCIPFFQQGFGGLFRGRIDNQLGEVLGGNAGRIGRMETRCALADECRHGGDAAVGQHHRLQGVADARGGLEAAAFRQTNLDGETIAFGHGHHLDVEGQEHQHAEGDGPQAYHDGEQRVLEAMALHLVVEALQEAEKTHLCPHKAVVPRLVRLRLDEHDFQRRDDQHGVGQGSHQRESHGPGEELHKITQRPRDDACHGEEHAGDGRRGDEHGHE